MVFALNIGNTIITLGGFEEDCISFTASISTRKTATAYEYANSIVQILSLHGVAPGQVEGAIVSSVVPMLTAVLKQSLELLCQCRVLVVSAGVKTGLNIKVSQSTNLGTDFVCNAVSAVKYHPLPCAVFSLGTATTVCAIDQKGQLLGTSIMAGVQTSLEGLCDRAVRLPQISLEAPNSLIGTNTFDSMQSGFIFGTASMIDGMGKRYAQILGENTTFVITGQYAKSILPYCENTYVYDEHLLLKGLYVIYRKNVRLK